MPVWRQLCTLLFALLLMSGLAFPHIPLSDPDTLWHIAAGDIIRRMSSIPPTDSWSFTSAGTPWLNIAWLFDILLSLIHQLAGISGVSKLTITLMALHGALMLFAAVRYSRNIIASVIVCAVSTWALFPSMLARPQWITCLAVLTFVLVLRFHERRAVWLLPVVMIAWVNIHGGFFLGLLIVGVFFFESLLLKDYPRAKRIFVCGILCSLATLVNPLGWHLPEAVFRTMGSSVMPHVVEWQPLQLSNAPFVVLYVTFFIALSGLRDQAIPPAERLLALLFFVMALSSARMLQVAASVAVPYLAMALANTLSSSSLADRIRKKNIEYERDLSARYFSKVSAIAALSSFFFLWSPVPERLLAKEAFSLPVINTPEKELAFIQQQHPTLRFFNHYDFGGYIIYATRGSLQVFIDGRADTAYPRELVKDYVSLMFSSGESSGDATPDADEIFRKYGVQGVLTRRDDMLDRVLSVHPGWKKVFSGETASVLVRR